MSATMPAYLNVEPDQLGTNSGVKLNVVNGIEGVANAFADALFTEISQAADQRRDLTLIVPVGPVDQYPILARKINQSQLSCRHVVFINMDEYLTDDDQWIDEQHPLSFRSYMNRSFYDLLDANCAPPMDNRVVPDPNQPEQIGGLIKSRGGVDTCYGGIGINGHMAFNEPPNEAAGDTGDDFASRPTRVLSLTPETRTINSNTVGGEISIIPHRAITVGMSDILSARRLRFYCNRPWQSAVVRRVLHGPITPQCPASYMRTHADAQLTIADYVHQKPDIRLR